MVPAVSPRDGRLRARGETAGTMIYKLSVMLAILNRGVTAEYKVKPRCPSSRTPPDRRVRAHRAPRARLSRSLRPGSTRTVADCERLARRAARPGSSRRSPSVGLTCARGTRLSLSRRPLRHARSQEVRASPLEPRPNISRPDRRVGAHVRAMLISRAGFCWTHAHGDVAVRECLAASSRAPRPHRSIRQAHARAARFSRSRRLRLRTRGRSP